jgi:hypothetical protein
LDIETGKLLFEWKSLDHVSPYGTSVHSLLSRWKITNCAIESILPINPGQAGSGYNSSDAWDYFHINSVDKDDNGDYLISARDAAAVHKISGKTGEIIWRLGGTNSSFSLGKNVGFSFQHHARYVSRSKDGTEETISLFDNSAHGTESGRGHEVHNYPYSRGKIIKVNTKTKKATLVQAFNAPDNLLAKSQGSTHLLPHGGALVNWGSEGAITEFNAKGKPIFHAYLDSGELFNGVQNYRAFRYNWTGLPNETPAIVSIKHKKGTTAYVSWNGDTETAAWRFYASTHDQGSRQFLGESKRRGFETNLTVSGQHISAVTADAVDSRGKVLVSTGIAITEQSVDQVRAEGLKVDDSEFQTPLVKLDLV